MLLLRCSRYFHYVKSSGRSRPIKARQEYDIYQPWVVWYRRKRRWYWLSWEKKWVKDLVFEKQTTCFPGQAKAKEFCRQSKAQPDSPETNGASISLIVLCLRSNWTFENSAHLKLSPHHLLRLPLHLRHHLISRTGCTFGISAKSCKTQSSIVF